MVSFLARKKAYHILTISETIEKARKKHVS